MGDKQAAEAEFDGFLRDYPQSILVHGAVKRIARLHGGDVPKEAEALWKQAMSVQKAADEAARRAESLCGPECLAELLRRTSPAPASGYPPLRNGEGRSGAPDVQSLAVEMKTNGEGTTLASLKDTANRHGLKLQGVMLTPKGLAKQKLPLIALIAPGHYVLVESVTPSSVTAWDPDAKGVGAPGRRTFPIAEWEKAWSGAALR